MCCAPCYCFLYVTMPTPHTLFCHASFYCRRFSSLRPVLAPLRQWLFIG